MEINCSLSNFCILMIGQVTSLISRRETRYLQSTLYFGLFRVWYFTPRIEGGRSRWVRGSVEERGWVRGWVASYLMRCSQFLFCHSIFLMIDIFLSFPPCYNLLTMRSEISLMIQVYVPQALNRDDGIAVCHKSIALLTDDIPLAY